MPELAEKIAAASEAAKVLRAAEQEVEKARETFRLALVEAHKAGASYGLLGRVVGLSRQRVARIIGG